MRLRSLKTRLFASFLAVVFVLGLNIFMLGYSVIKTDILERAQSEVGHWLNGAAAVYRGEIERIGQTLQLVTYEGDLGALRERLNLHYLFRVGAEEASRSGDLIVRRALAEGRPVGGTRLIGPDELARMDPQMRSRADIAIRPTPMARPTSVERLDTAMAKEYAVPLSGTDGKIEAVVYGGRIINQDYELVDRIRSLVFGSVTYKERPVGTVTIFQDDVRISTNVLNQDGTRAIGTRVSEQVYEQVVERGETWHDRAFVVTDWYKTAYEPIRDIEGNVLGILYVGILEQPFNDTARRILAVFLTIIAFTVVLGGALSYILAGAISRPLTHMLDATRRISTGELGHIITAEASISELHELARAFNEMSARLEERELHLRITNDKLEESNKSYLEMIGFVTHELKGLLASAIMNAYSIRDGFLGMINFKQKRAIDSICRNLDYLSATVKKFLNLSRIERGNLELNRTRFSLKTGAFDPALDTFAKMISDKRMTVESRLDEGVEVVADADLMQIVANNLVNNAAKYGSQGGRIVLGSRILDGRVEVEVYNDGRPIPEQETSRLFKRFSRLDNPEKKKVKGTGLGLYITRQIIEAHGGRIWVEPREQGNSFVFSMERGV